jgi:tetratricopeptide (TPR) repeat protein
MVSLDLKTVFKQLNEAYAQCSPEELDDRIHEIIHHALLQYNKTDIRRASVLNELGGYYRHLFRIEESEKAFLEANEIFKLLKVENSPDYATSINNLAGLYRISGEYEKAEKLFLQAIQIYKNTVTEEHYLYPTALSNFALLYQDMKRYEEAAELLTHACDYFKKKPDLKSQAAYATTAANLATVYIKMKRFNEAEALLLDSLNAYEKTLGGDAEKYGDALNNLGSVYYETGDIWKQRNVRESPENLPKPVRL